MHWPLSKGRREKLVADELVILVEESLDDSIRASYHNAQNGICSVVYNVVEKGKLDLLRKELLGKTLDADVSELFDLDAAADRLSKRLLTSSSFIAPIDTFVDRESDSSISDKNKVFAKASIMKPAGAMEVIGDIVKDPPRQSDSDVRSPAVGGPQTSIKELPQNARRPPR